MCQQIMRLCLNRAARIQRAPYTAKYLDHGFFRDYSKLQYYSTIRPGSGVGANVVTDVLLCATSFPE